jgi:hypothetical protein
VEKYHYNSLSSKVEKGGKILLDHHTGSTVEKQENINERLSGCVFVTIRAVYRWIKSGTHPKWGLLISINTLYKYVQFFVVSANTRTLGAALAHYVGMNLWWMQILLLVLLCSNCSIIPLFGLSFSTRGRKRTMMDGELREEVIVNDVLVMY